MKCKWEEGDSKLLVMFQKKKVSEQDNFDKEKTKTLLFIERAYHNTIGPTISHTNILFLWNKLGLGSYLSFSFGPALIGRRKKRGKGLNVFE